MKKIKSLLFVAFLVGSLTFALSAHAHDNNDRRGNNQDNQDDQDNSEVITTSSLDTEPTVSFPTGSDLFPPLVDVSKFLSTPVATSTTSSSLQRIIDADVKLVNARLSALASLKVEINSSTYLTGTQKTTLSTMVDTNVSGLNALLTKIKADTDLATLKADSEKIYTNFRIFSVFTPKIRASIAFYAQANYSAKAGEVVATVQSKINDFKDSGVDMTDNQAALDAAKAALVQADAKIATMTAKVTDLDPSDFPTLSATIINQLKVGVSEVRSFFIQVSDSLKAAIKL
ncbi:MAG: hypothetical protein NT034_02965 [Candidatus Magasanikbacteria bacterium]|nr:hypothetical protein [Candidatus Magasanikbacteria bacterium]